ncbi:nudix hydrolase 8-like isoform X2 [Malania oleifera]|uniref:nudix hydrolase 8-like isoform X2 n=1 Tax=Malania oleifera TaxID=397392 RepID=UPI0025AEAA21|nr:nudix hydrolase 8-like isoform X2 [Malania oleifera]
MEWKLFDSKSVCAAETVRGGRTCSSTVSIFKRRTGFISCRSVFPKASNSSTSNKSIGSVGQENIAVEACSYLINRASGSSFLFSKDKNVLNAFDDEYGGVVVDPERLPANPNVFASLLHSSLSRWKMEGKKGIWLKLPVEQSELVPIAVKEGFNYHHAEKGYVMLTYWIPEGPCMLPANASHQVGVGGFVINDKNEVLVVQEKYCSPDFVGLWKLPTGFIHESEEIFTGAVREVKEETGIDTEFVEVIAFSGCL